jgi:hypothetical protein
VRHLASEREKKLLNAGDWQHKSLERLEYFKQHFDKKNNKNLKLESLERIIRRIAEFSPTCTDCQRYQPMIDDILHSLGGQLQSSREDRRTYYKNLRELTTHMTKKHHLRAAGTFIALGLSMGPGIGISLGVAMGNIGAGLAIGTGFGLVLGSGLEARAKREGKII